METFSMDYTLSLLKDCKALQAASKMGNIEIPQLPLSVLTGTPYVNDRELQVGHELFVMSDDPGESYVRILVTHKYKHWVFYEVREGVQMGSEHFFSVLSPFFQEFVLPISVKIPVGWADRIKLPSLRITLKEV